MATFLSTVTNLTVLHDADILQRGHSPHIFTDFSYQGADTGNLDLGAYEPEVVDCMIEFLYTYDYSISATSSTSIASKFSSSPSPERASIVSDVQTIAASSDMDLKSDRSSINVSANSQVDTGNSLITHTEVYALAETLNLPRLKHTAANKYAICLRSEPSLADFVNSLSLIQTKISAEDTVLKDIAIGYAVDHVGQLADSDDFMAFCEAFSVNRFLMQMLVRMTEMVIKACPKCKSMKAVKAIRKPTGKYLHNFLCSDCNMDFN